MTDVSYLNVAMNSRGVLSRRGFLRGVGLGVAGLPALSFTDLLAVQAEGSKVVTIEGLSNDEALTPLQASFRRHHALQCGFCTPGMITTAHALLSEEPDCDADRVREVLSGNICRCTGYISIVEAVLDARAAYRKPEGRS